MFLLFSCQSSKLGMMLVCHADMLQTPARVMCSRSDIYQNYQSRNNSEETHIDEALKDLK
jgi:hypothetical protein